LEARIATVVLQVLLTVAGAPFLLWKGWRQRRLRMRDLDTNEDTQVSWEEASLFLQKNLHFVLDVAAAVAIVAAGVSRMTCADGHELRSLAVSSILLCFNLMNVLMPFRAIGVLVITMYKILRVDVVRFLAVYAIILLGFAWGMFLCFQRNSSFHGCALEAGGCPDEPEAFSGVGSSLLWLVWVSLGDNVGDIQTIYRDAQDPGLVVVAYLAWVVLSSVLLLNLLIAMMSKTFEKDDEDTDRVWMFPFAALVLRYERLLSEKKVRSGCAAWNIICGVPQWMVLERFTCKGPGWARGQSFHSALRGLRQIDSVSVQRVRTGGHYIVWC
jgi:hypothetical protein